MIDRYLDFCWEHPKRLVAVVAGFTVLLSLLTFGRLDFDAKRDALFKATTQEVERQHDFERRFGSWRNLVLVVEGGSKTSRELAVQRLEELFKASPLVTELRAKVELPGLDRLGLYFLSVQDLQEIDKALADYGALLQHMVDDGWYGFLEFLHEEHNETKLDSKNRLRFAKIWEQAVNSRGSGALDSLFPKIELPERSYYQDGDRRHLVYIQSPDPLALNTEIKKSVLSLGFEGRVILTGQPLLQAEERRDTIRDATISTILAIVVVQLLLIRGFREMARPRLAFLSLFFGLLWSVAWAALAIGTLNIITINFVAITVGLGVDFSIHILARYAEECVGQADSRRAMASTLRTTGRENFVGAMATALAFWALVLTDFLAVQQLGVITGVGVPLCFLSVVTLLPPLLFWREQYLSSRGEAGSRHFEFKNPPRLLKFEQSLREHPRTALGLMSAAIFLLALYGSKVHFDYNLLNMHSAGSEAVIFEREGGFNSLAAFVVADSPAAARLLKEKLVALPSVSEVQTVAELLPEEIESKRILVGSIVNRVQLLSLPTFDPSLKPDWTRLQVLASDLKSDGERAAWLRSLQNSGPGPVEDIWKQMQRHLKSELTQLITRLGKQDPHLDLKEWKHQAPDVQRLSNLDGKTLLRVRSKGTLWDRKVLIEFLDEIETVTHDGVGPPYLIRNYLEQLRDSYFDAVGYAVLAIVVLLALHFRAIIPTLIALVPKVVGAVGMFAAMAAADIHLNPANCMALPLTLGIGLVFGIHAVHRCLESPDALLVQGATGKAIALSGWTTIVSFGTLMAANHPGIFSLGFVMASGVAANMLATYLLIPPLIVFFRDRL